MKKTILVLCFFVVVAFSFVILRPLFCSAITESGVASLCARTGAVWLAGGKPVREKESKFKTNNSYWVYPCNFPYHDIDLVSSHTLGGKPSRQENSAKNDLVSYIGFKTVAKRIARDNEALRADRVELRKKLQRLFALENGLVADVFWLNNHRGQKVNGKGSYLYEQIKRRAQFVVSQCLEIRFYLYQMYTDHLQAKLRALKTIQALRSYKEGVFNKKGHNFLRHHKDINRLLVAAVEQVALLNDFPGADTFKDFCRPPAKIVNIGYKYDSYDRAAAYVESYF